MPVDSPSENLSRLLCHSRLRNPAQKGFWNLLKWIHTRPRGAPSFEIGLKGAHPENKPVPG